MASTETAGQPAPASTIVVLAADSSRARLFKAEHKPEQDGEHMQELLSLHNAEARAHEHDLTADRAGRRGNAPMSGGHSKHGGGSMKDHRAEDFAKKVCDRLGRAVSDTRADGIYIVAEPGFLGLLRNRMDSFVRKQVRGEVSRSVTAASPDDIRAQLPPRL